MCSVADTPVERLVTGIKLVAVAPSEASEVELRHSGKFTVAAYIDTDTEDSLKFSGPLANEVVHSTTKQAIMMKENTQVYRVNFSLPLAP